MNPTAAWRNFQDLSIPPMRRGRFALNHARVWGNHPASNMGKILVIRGGAIGDFILTLPVLQAIQANLPANDVEGLGYPRIARLAVAGGLAARVESIESRAVAGFFARHGPLAESLRDYFSEFDLIISFLYDPDEIFQENVRRCTTGQFIAGPHRPDETQNLHATACFLKPLERLAIFEAEAFPRLAIERTDNGPASALKLEMATGNWLAIHPGSGSEKKNWPESGWRQFIEQLLAGTDWKLLIIGGESEGGRLDRLAEAACRCPRLRSCSRWRGVLWATTPASRIWRRRWAGRESCSGARPTPRSGGPPVCNLSCSRIRAASPRSLPKRC